MLLKDKLNGWQLILASTSPRRRQILADSGLPFILAEPYEVNEIWDVAMPSEQVAEYLAALKSDAYPIPLTEKDILLTADTTVVIDECVLGKPRDRDEAIKMLEKLSGREHKVITGVVLRSGGHSKETGERHKEESDRHKVGGDRHSNAQNRISFSVESTVWFRELRPEEIRHYVDTYSPLDKAGGYGIQEWIGYVGVSRIEGSFYNVMGMPMQAIYVKLEEFLEI